MADTAVSSSPRELAQAPSEDPLDRPDFDVTAYINRLFPTEESLSGLDPLVASLQHRISRVDAGILASVRQQSRVGGRARADLAAARADVAALCARVAAIRSQAAASEALVQHICRDIRRLDAAKRHLTATISSLRRLGMLMAALDALQAAVERGDYAEAGNLLEAVQALAAHFAAYAHVPRVAELRGRLGALETSARGRALREFEALGEALPPPATLERLRACCGLVAALGYQVRCFVGGGGVPVWHWLVGRAKPLGTTQRAGIFSCAGQACGWCRHSAGTWPCRWWRCMKPQGWLHDGIQAPDCRIWSGLAAFHHLTPYLERHTILTAWASSHLPHTLIPKMIPCRSGTS